jgi:putative transposase
MTAWFHSHGYHVHHKRVARLLHTMGIEAIYPTPRLSAAHPTHRVDPYLLRGVPIIRVQQVWRTAITYSRLHGGFISLVAVMDWFSRDVLSWAVAVTMEVGLCLAALDQALDVAQPEIFHSAQGAQCTSLDCTDDWPRRGDKAAWTGEDERSTTSLLHGCGGPSNTRRSS